MQCASCRRYPSTIASASRQSRQPDIADVREDRQRRDQASLGGGKLRLATDERAWARGSSVSDAWTSDRLVMTRWR
jgi:hypothetical protein